MASNCTLGIQNLVKTTLNNKPWFEYDQSLGIVNILDSPKYKINKQSSFGVAKVVVNAINKQINNGYKNIGDIAFAKFDEQRRGYVDIAPTINQIQLINAQNEEEIYELQKQLDEEELLKGFYQTRETGNYDVVDGEIVVSTNNGFNDEYSLNDFQEEQKELDEIVEQTNNLEDGTKPDISQVNKDSSLNQTIKPGVEELFETDSNLANEIYEALGVEQYSEIELKPYATDVWGKVPKQRGDNNFVNKEQYSIKINTENKGIDVRLTIYFDDSNKTAFVSNIENFENDVTHPLKKGLGLKAFLEANRLITKRGYTPVIDNLVSGYGYDMMLKLEKQGYLSKVLNKNISNSQYDNIKYENPPFIFTNKIFENQITPQQKQQAQIKYSQYLEQNPNGNVEQFKSWVDEFNRNKSNLEQQSENKTIDEIYKEKPYLKEFIDSVTNEPNNISIYKVKNILDKHGEGRIVKLNKILYNAINRLWDNNIFAQNNIKIKFVDSLPENAVGNFNRDDNEITVDKRKFLNNVINEDKNYPIFYLGYILNHEIIHYLTPKDLSLKIEYVDRALNGKFGDTFNLTHEREFGKNIKELYDIAIKELDNNKDYGFLNLAEFVAEAMSNPSFQEKLASIPFKSSKQSLWKRFVEILSAYLSLYTKKPITDTLLEAVIAETTNYITENSNIQRTYKKRKSGKTENIDIDYDFVFTTQKGINSLSDFISQKSQDLQSFQQSLNNPNTNPILQGNQQEQVKKFTELQERLGNKEFLEGAKNAFESSEELQNVYYEALGFETVPVGWEKGKTLYDKAKPVKIDFKSGITILPNGNYLVRAYRTGDTGLGSKGYGQRGEGLYLSLTNPYPGKDVNTVEFEIPPSEIVTYKEEFSGTISYEKLKKRTLDFQFQDAVKDVGGKAFIGGINSSEDSNLEIVLYDKTVINKAISSKKKVSNFTTNYNLYDLITPQQKQDALNAYTDYLARVSLGIIKNPSSGEYNYTSKVKDIVYHISPNKFEKFDNKYIGSKKEKASPDNSMGIFFSKNKTYIKTQDTNNELGDIVYPTIVNLKNPHPNWLSELRVFVKGNFLDESSRQEYNDYKKWMINNNYDGFLEDSNRKFVVVFDANNTHILGSKQDIEGFKEFLSDTQKTEDYFNEESIHLAINNLATEEEMRQVFDEMTPSQIKSVKEIYTNIKSVRKEDDKINLAHEFIRMIIQDKYTGEITESSNPTLLGIINRLLNKVKEWLGIEVIKINEILIRFDNLVNKPQFNISEKSKELKALPNNQWFNKTIQPIINRFSKMFPNVRSVVISEKEIPNEVKSIVDGLDKQINSFFHKGQVYIIKERVTKDIAIEEFLHPFINALEQDNPELFKSLLLEAKKLFPELKEEIFTKYEKVYGSIFDLNREFLTQALTKKVSEQTPAQETFFQKFKSWIKNILNRLFGEEAFTRQLSELDEQISLTDLASILNENNTQFNFKTDTNTTYYSLSEEEVITILNKLKGENVTEKQKELTKLILNNNKETEFIADTHEYFTNNLGEKVALKPVSGFLPKFASDKIFEDFDKIGNVIHDIVKTMNVEKLTEQQFISKYYENSSLKKFFVEEKGFPDSSAKQIISNIYSYISMIGKNSILISEVSISHLQDINEEFKGVAGTIDLLEIKEDGSIVIHDFKSMYLNSEEKSSTNKESTAASIKFNQKKKTYELQLSLYKKLLQGIIPENKGIELQIYPIFYLAKKETIGNTIKVVFNEEPSVNIDFTEQQNYIFNAINNLDFLESIKKYKLDYNVKFANEILPSIEEPKAKKVLSKLEIDRNELLEKMTDKLKSDNSKELEREIEKTFKQVTILVKQYGNSENELNKALFKLFDPNNELKDTKNNFEVIFKSLSTLDKDDPVAFKHYLSNLVQYVNFIQEINVSLNNIKDNFLVIKSQTKTDTEKIADYRKSYLLAKSNKDRIGETLLQMKDISEDNLFKQMVRLSISNIEEIENLYYKETLPLIANTIDSYLTPELKQEVNDELTKRLNKIKYDLTLDVSESNRKILLEELELKEKEISIINDPNLISKMIKGEFGDGHWFYSNLVANINNSNYVISGTSLMMQSILKEISIIAIRTQDDLGKEFSKRELVYGVNRDQVKKMNEDLVTTTTRFFENADGTIEDLKSMTFITEVDQQVYEDLKKLEILHKNAKTDEEKEKTLTSIKDFKELHFVSKYNPKYLNILNKIDVKVSDGRNIMEIRNAIFNDINAIKISEGKENYKEGNITEENQRALKELYRKLFNLSSSFDRNGNKKQGADLEIAEILQSRSAELEEFRKKEVDEQTWNKLKTKKIQELLPKYNNEDQVLKSEEYKLWQSFNTVISPTKEFYDERKKILEEINFILDKKEYKDVVLVGQLKDNLNQSWEKLLAISREYRDFEREVMAQDVPDGTKKAMKTLEENIDKIKSQIKVLEKSLSKQDKKDLNGLWDDYNSMVEYKNSKYYEEDLENELNKYALENEIELSELKNNKSLLVDFRLNNEWYINNHVQKEKFDVASQEMIVVNEPAYYYKVIIPTNSDFLEESPAMQYNSFELKDEAYNLDKDGKPNYLDVFGRLKVKSSSPYITENLPYLKLKNDLSKKAMVTKENLLKIQEYLEKWQQGANKNNLIYYQVPSKFKKAFERLSEGNLKTITQNIADNLFKMSNDEKEFGTRGVLASLSGEEMKFIPVLGKYKTDFTDQSYDVWQSLLEYGMSITKAKMFEEKLPVFDTLIDQLEKNPPTEDASKLEAIGSSLANKFNLPNITETIKGKGTNTLQAVRDEIAKGIYEEFSKELGTFMGVSDVKLTNTLLGVAGTTMMLGKVANWTVNALSGNIQVLIESAGKRYFNTKDVANAKLELGKRTKDVLEDVSKLSDKSLIGQLTDYFDPMKGEFMDELGNKFSWSKRTNVQKILFSGKIFGEWEMQMTTFIAMLKAKKVKRILPNGTTIIIDLYDAFEKGTDGIPVLKEGVQFTEKELMAYSFKIQGVNKMLNGSYAKIDQTKIEKYSLGKAAFFMKKYLVPLFVQRFGEFRQDLELQDFREGHYRIFYKTLLLDLKRLGIKNIAEIYAKFSKTPDEGGYTDFQKEGIRKTLTEFAIITMILVALPLLGYGDDDDDSDTAKYAQYIALKLKREVGLFTPLAATQELTSLIERPFIAVGAASNIIDLGASILKLPLNVAFGAFEDDLYYQRKTALWDEGDSKILSLALKTAGLQVAITNPEQLLQSYKYSIR